MIDLTGSSTGYKFSLEQLNGLTSPLSRLRNTNTELTGSLEAATSTTSQQKENDDQYLTTNGSQAQSYNQDKKVKLFEIVQ